eukprot:gnl/TRDRNA2_/TRDRNA2_175628_c0_seq1.p1 gnl/TRDRNA2_/TRDRNA2_175628_c0~~gnl/TRDRNA2_/TRDRNA2_175628_c0_seq1.p1  ORF type:complete len:177 (+),score=29.71 gnl/TRDRNA2_/TRDRNA2_175628_c0_seq1:20-550(+)
MRALAVCILITCLSAAAELQNASECDAVALLQVGIVQTSNSSLPPRGHSPPQESLPHSPRLMKENLMSIGSQSFSDSGQLLETFAANNVYSHVPIPPCLSDCETQPKISPRDMKSYCEYACRQGGCQLDCPFAIRSMINMMLNMCQCSNDRQAQELQASQGAQAVPGMDAFRGLLR